MHALEAHSKYINIKTFKVGGFCDCGLKERDQGEDKESQGSE